ncbi:uncharacterized protein LOC107607088 [Arachis ipaensis]|uniref:uncharacterized protein LOC107607088 n=1 Tax=Arachis ipaensis TaxID=130454 RepID=UPI0007AF0CFF|nr:uncharacterized protein LOC107607088 [Arachis ipaensis]
MGFGIRWRTWVKKCVTTASMSILINGSPTKPFKMERGLRQGDPLSPFLFVLVVDVLHRMVGEAVRNSRISPLLVRRDNIKLSHLQFADDTILFCPQKTERLVNYKRLLRCFELMSGLSINFEKSSLISVNCEKEWVTNMCGLLGCGEALDPTVMLSNQPVPSRGGPWKDICQLNIKEQQARDMMIRGLLIEVLQNETLPTDITSYNFTSSIWRGLVWCAWLTFSDRAWAIPGTTKEFYESWIEATGRKSEQRKWLIEFCAVI